MSTTRSSSSACSWRPSRSWLASARSSPTRAMTPNTTATSAASSAPSRTFTSAVGRMDQGSASGAGQSSAAMPGCSRTGASRCATTGSASSCSRCSRPLVYSWLQGGLPGNSENRLLGRKRPRKQQSGNAGLLSPALIVSAARKRKQYAAPHNSGMQREVGSSLSAARPTRWDGKCCFSSSAPQRRRSSRQRLQALHYPEVSLGGQQTPQGGGRGHRGGQSGG